MEWEIYFTMLLYSSTLHPPSSPSSSSSSFVIISFLVLEEITHQAGNFKKYNIFVKMLITAFSQESKNVYIDLLTYNDLQNLRARKLGISNATTTTSFTSQSQTSQSSQAHLKRYIILSYESEFDRVNFPLSLTYEENPNVFALQKTIKRLRLRLKEAQTIPATSKER